MEQSPNTVLREKGILNAIIVPSIEMIDPLFPGKDQTKGKSS
jgi:hypothetical protein